MHCLNGVQAHPHRLPTSCVSCHPAAGTTRVLCSEWDDAMIRLRLAEVGAWQVSQYWPAVQVVPV